MTGKEAYDSLKNICGELSDYKISQKVGISYPTLKRWKNGFQGKLIERNRAKIKNFKYEAV